MIIVEIKENPLFRSLRASRAIYRIRGEDSIREKKGSGVYNSWHTAKSSSSGKARGGRKEERKTYAQTEAPSLLLLLYV